MRLNRRHLTLAAALAAVLLAAILPAPGGPRPAAAQITDAAGDSFGSAVPCLTAADRFAVTCFADTIFEPAPSGEPAAVEVGLSTKAPLAALGTNNLGGAGARVAGGVGSVYGLAYDDGALSGAPRLFMAAYLKRLSGFGQGGPGGVYVYDLARRAGGDAPLFVVPGAGWDRPAGAADPTDRGAAPWVGRSGLGDMEISPDGRELFIVNLSARRIERYDITGASPVRRAPIPIDDGVRDANDALDAVWAPLRAQGQAAQEAAARTDTVPFALEFSPLGAADAPLLVLGLTDTSRRAVRGDGAEPPAGYPAIHLATYALRTGTWSHSLTQSLSDPAIRDRMRDSQIDGTWASTTMPSAENPYGARGIRGWNPWHDSLATMPRAYVVGLNQAILYPQPLLSDIEFSHDGRRMYLGLRDRTGDMVFAAEAPPGDYSAVAQGDTLVYSLRGGAWAIQTTTRPQDLANSNGGDQFVRPAPSDVFDDNRHSFGLGIAPFHVENHGGALATAIQGDGRAIVERVATTSLLGDRRSGVAFYGEGGGYWAAAPNTLVTAASASGGKSAILGDLEPLCTYAFVGGRVWHDADGEGDQDATGEPGIAGVTLEAFRGPSSTAVPIARATTDAGGFYRFALPPNADVRIRIGAADRAPGGAVAAYRFTAPNRAGGDDARDSDASDVWGFVEFAGSRAAPVAGETGVAIPPPVREQELSGVDIGLTQRPASGEIGNLVWIDHNRSGLQDTYTDPQSGTTYEPALDVRAMSAMAFTLVPDPDTAIIAASPSLRLATGTYRFMRLPPGRYAVRFGSLPAGYSVATPRARGGSQDALDSDAAPPDLTTRYVTIAAPTSANPSAHLNHNLDLGLVPNAVDMAITMTATASALPGGAISYNLTAFSAGLSRLSAPNVTVVQQLPPGVAVDLAATTPRPQVAGSVAAGQTLTWGFGTLAPASTRAISVRATAPTAMPQASPGQQLSSSASVATTAQEATLANNRAAAATLLVRPELAVAKLGPAEVIAGEEFGYTLRVTNSGSAAAVAAGLEDRLPPGIAFVRWQGQAPAGCSALASPASVRCGGITLPAGGQLEVRFVARADPPAPGSVTNVAALAGLGVADNPADNQAALTTRVLRPNPGVQVAIVPSAGELRGGAPVFPVATAGEIRVRYANGLAAPPAGEHRGSARATTLALTLSGGGYTLGPLPAGCARAGDRVSCALGDLAPGAAGSLALPIALPADFAPDRLQATATIATATQERPADQADNTSTAGVDVVRPNVFVDAQGPDTIVGRGSVFWYTLEYGNIHRRSPALTRTARGVILRATLPDAVSLVEANMPLAATDGRRLTWELGDLAPGATGRIIVVVRTDVAAGAALRLDAAISTTSPGDSPADNADSVTTDVVQPPERIPGAAGDMRLAISSDLDPNRRDPAPANGVYLTDGPRLTWPAGEALDFTPRLRRLIIEGEAQLPYPYAYRARVVGWSLRAVTVDGAAHDPAGADSLGRAGCRPGAAPAGRPQLLGGCAYGYVDGASIEAIRRAAPLREEQLRGQPRIYWTRPPAPPLPGEIYAYAADQLAVARLAVQVEIELQIVNVAPGEIGGVPLPEVPVVPLPDPERRLIAETFEVTLIVPRSVVGPGTP